MNTCFKVLKTIDLNGENLLKQQMNGRGRRPTFVFFEIAGTVDCSENIAMPTHLLIVFQSLTNSQIAGHDL